MVTLGEAVQDEIASDNLQQNKSPGSTSNEIKSGQEGASLSLSPKKESVELEKIEISGNKLYAAECNKEGNTQLEKSESSNENQSGQEGAPHSVPPKEGSVELVKKESSTLSASPKKESVELVKTVSSSDKFSAAQCNKEVNTQHIKTEGELENVQPGQSSDSKIKTETSVSSREGTPLSVIPGVPQNVQPKQSPSISPDETSGSTQGASLALIPVEVSDKSELNQKSDAGNSAANRELSIHTTIHAKPLNSLQPAHSYNTGTGMLHRDQEVKTPSRIPDKASLDGYNWRKYGQKLVKGNEFVRSYYRCTHPNCAAKRQVERSHEGQITDTVYLGKHEHPKPQPSPRAAGGSAQPVQAMKSAESSLAVGTDKSSSAPAPESRLAEPVETPHLSIPADNSPQGVTPQSYRTRDELDNSKEPEPKKQKRDISNTAMTPVEKSNGESRVVVQTMSDVDIVNDGFRWRKYGQKLVKGNPNPRSYYRCSNPGCPVKKHVERASHDPKVVITTYEGHHDHGTPPCRTVTPNTSGPTVDAADMNNNESRPKSEENGAACVDMAVHISAN